MSLINENQYIASLILKEKIMDLSQPERERLNAWLRADVRNEEIYLRLSCKDFSEDLITYSKIDTGKGLERYREKYACRKRFLAPKWYWVAAVVACIICISNVLFYQQTPVVPSQVAVVPGSSKAKLVLHDGNVVELAGGGNSELAISRKLSIHSTGKELNYVGVDSVKGDCVMDYNELIVPKGGEFSLTLSDGTKVWMNAQSKLRFPVVFNDTVREVLLEGEAYFEVTKDLKRPFRVHAKQEVCIEVLGTSFNVRSYSDEDRVETVLEEGRVKVKKGSESVILTPGYRATCMLNETAIVTQAVESELYTTWRMGRYIFLNESVENILKQLARWYDVEIRYEQEIVKTITISGDVQKYDNINVFLNAMEVAGGMRFRVDKGVVIVSLQ